MKLRCQDSRGIRFDPRWQAFATFLADMGECPPDLTLDRVNVLGHYCKSNCRYATDIQQANNKRKTETLYYDFENYGAEGSPAEWARHLRTISGNSVWTVPYLKRVLKALSLDQIVCAVHPNRLTPRELEERTRAAKMTEEQRQLDAFFDRMLASL